MKSIDAQVLDNALTYEAYWKLTLDLFEKGMTTGPIQNEALLNYTKLNIARMKRLDKKTIIQPNNEAKITQIQDPITWLVLSESWCGDAAQILPVLAKLAELNDLIDFKIILRDEHLDIMDAFLTNGARSIPKVIILKNNGKDSEVIGSWGPRPGILQQLVMDTKAQLADEKDAAVKKQVWTEVKTEIQRWYAKDKTQAIQDEIVDALLEHLNQ